MVRTSSRAVREDIQNALDYLSDAELCLAVNAIEVVHLGQREDAPGTVSVRFAPFSKDAGFLLGREHPGVEQYLSWLESGYYSAVLFDGSLVQIAYKVSKHGDVVGHRLAYMPCPYDVDPKLLATESIFDALDLYAGGSDVVLRSQIRFDYDPIASAPGHPPVHLTVNSPDCRIGLIAPLHVLRFLDFIFRHYYPRQHQVHARFFASGAWRHVGGPLLSEDERADVHLAWDVRARMTSIG